MAQVDPDDEDIVRYVVRHFRYDPERHERRHVAVAAYDNEPEFLWHVEALGEDLRRRKERGEADPKEWVSGTCLGPGHRQQEQQRRWEARRLFSRRQEG